MVNWRFHDLTIPKSPLKKFRNMPWIQAESGPSSGLRHQLYCIAMTFIDVFWILEFQKEPPKNDRTMQQCLRESGEFQPKFSTASPALLQPCKQ
jgi:hypothetical protein